MLSISQNLVNNIDDCSIYYTTCIKFTLTYRHLGAGMIDKSQFRFLASQQHADSFLAGLVVCNERNTGEVRGDYRFF